MELHSDIKEKARKHLTGWSKRNLITQLLNASSQRRLEQWAKEYDSQVGYRAGLQPRREK